MTISGAIELCRRKLGGVSETPWLEARILTSYVTGLDASAVVAYGDNVLDSRRFDRLLALAKRRAAGEPVAYIVGYKEFRGLRISVDRRVLVPRPETEDVVEAVVADWRGRDADILELGTGSGAIACALAQELPRATIVATDISADALQVAEANVARLAIGERVELKAGDLFEAVPEDRSFDAIVANLPYIGSRDAAAVQDNVLKFEPGSALFAGHDGLSAYQRLLPQSRSRLRNGGMLYLECSPFNAAELAALAKQTFPHGHVEVVNDAAQRTRIVTIKTRSHPA
jgi:release factor glutamine methyltransferase